MQHKCHRNSWVLYFFESISIYMYHYCTLVVEDHISHILHITFLLMAYL